MLIEGVAASPQRVLAPVGSHVVAAVAASSVSPVWCALGIGRRLPTDYVDAIADRGSSIGRIRSIVDIDELPLR